MNTIKILIADDHQEWCDILKEQLARYSYFDIAEPFCSGDDALRYITEHQPDVLILDLFMPVVDGLYIINHVREEMEGYDPFIYLISAFGASRTNHVLRNIAVDYYSIKPISARVVADNVYRLLLNHKSLQHMLPDLQGQPRGEETPAPSYPLFPNLDILVEDYLYDLGAPLSLYSTKCTREAIKYCIANNPEFTKIMRVYKAVAEAFQPSVKYTAIERNIRSTVKIVREKGNEFYQKCFPENAAKLNNSDFLYTSAYILRHQIEERFGDQIPVRKPGGVRQEE